MRRPLVVFALASVASMAGIAHAEDVKHVASITFSPIHLAFPIVEVTGEVLVQKDIGVAAILGYGSVSVTESTTGPGGTTNDKVRFSAWETGAQFRYYLVGSFDHGMQLGAELLYLHVAGTSSASPSLSGVGTGFAIGPFVGYKIATNVGFTFDAQLGAEWLTARASAKDSTSSSSASTSGSTVIPLLNLNVGWSF